MEPRLVLFDIDGTLIDTAGAGRRAMERAFHEVFGIDSVARKGAGVPFAGMTDWRIFEDLARALGIRDDLFDTRFETLRRIYVRALRIEMQRPDPRRRVLPGIRELLDTLEEHPRAFLGLLTGNLETGARTKLEPFDLNRYFPTGGFGSDHPDRRQVARLACEKLSEWTGLPFTGSRVVVVGDTEADVDCAKANGFRSVAVQSGWGSRESLEAARPDALFADLTDRRRVLEAIGIAMD